MPGYRGELQIGDGLVHLRNREYDPTTGQFLGVDPLQGVAGTTAVANPYQYANNDPLGNVDATGLSATDYSFCEFFIISGRCPERVERRLTSTEWASAYRTTLEQQAEAYGPDSGIAALLAPGVLDGLESRSPAGNINSESVSGIHRDLTASWAQTCQARSCDRVLIAEIYPEIHDIIAYDPSRPIPDTISSAFTALGLYVEPRPFKVAFTALEALVETLNYIEQTEGVDFRYNYSRHYLVGFRTATEIDWQVYAWLFEGRHRLPSGTNSGFDVYYG